MPLPTPSPDESEEAFIARAMGSEHMKSKWPKGDHKQRLAVAYAQWKKRKTMKADLGKVFKLNPYDATD